MSENPVELLVETKEMSAYDFLDWVESRSNSELKSLAALSKVLSTSVNREMEKRNKE